VQTAPHNRRPFRWFFLVLISPAKWPCTGVARGLGNAISLALAHAGADVALGLRDVNRRGDLADQIGAMGRRAVPLQMDVRRLDQTFQAVDDTVMHLGRLDILVDNAGLAPDNLAENVIPPSSTLRCYRRSSGPLQERFTPSQPPEAIQNVIVDLWAAYRNRRDYYPGHGSKWNEFPRLVW
jgi:NAD(P)-dependent dehydrogenase (short-subunit alcohol dehydrogenase family)